MALADADRHGWSFRAENDRVPLCAEEENETASQVPLCAEEENETASQVYATTLMRWRRLNHANGVDEENATERED